MTNLSVEVDTIKPSPRGRLAHDDRTKGGTQMKT